MQLKTAVVKWMDAQGLGSWQTPAEVQKQAVLCHIVSMGFVVKDTDNEIALASTVAEDGLCTDGIVIPKNWITNIQYFGEMETENIKKY